MFRQILIFAAILSFSYGNVFTITDKKGRIIHSKDIKHTENACINQKATEYSLQAIYNELHKAENLARMAEAARKRAARIVKAQQVAKQMGKSYHISEADRQQLLIDAKYFKGGKYIWGGTSPDGFDCSGYVQYLYKKHNCLFHNSTNIELYYNKSFSFLTLLKFFLFFSFLLVFLFLNI